MTKNFFLIITFFVVNFIFAQAEIEVVPPYHIKTISFEQSNENVIPIFKLGDGFQMRFDDLHGDEADYYFEIVHCDYNWNKSDIPKNEYLKGFDGQRIIQYENSINTLQLFSNYVLPIPNQFVQLRISGNYMLKILDKNKEVAFSRKFVVYEDLVTVPIQITMARTAKYLNKKHNLDFSIRSAKINFQNPLKNIKVLLFQNGQWNTGIKNIAPQYTIGNDLIYKYETETQFWAGTEFLFFDNSNLRGVGNAVAKIETKNDIYGSYLFTNYARVNNAYSFTQDINGGFFVRNLNSSNNAIEADYAWIYFSLLAPNFKKDKDIYVTGMFNNFGFSEENKMEFNTDKNLFEKAIYIKQGFTNYQFQIADETGKIDDENAVDGHFWQTENDYTILVYYRENNDRYQRVIGKATTKSINIIN